MQPCSPPQDNAESGILTIAMQFLPTPALIIDCYMKRVFPISDTNCLIRDVPTSFTDLSKIIINKTARINRQVPSRAKKTQLIKN